MPWAGFQMEGVGKFKKNFKVKEKECSKTYKGIWIFNSVGSSFLDI